MESSATSPIPLMKFLIENLVIEDYENVDKRYVTKKLAELMGGKELVAIGNHNGHNYIIGKPIVLDAANLYKRMSVEYKLNSKPNSFKLVKVNFVSLVHDGNNILADDMAIYVDVPVRDYLNGLKLLRDIITFEIDFIVNSSEGDKQEVLSKTLLSILSNPISIPNHINLKNILASYEKEVGEYKRKQEMYHKMSAQKIFITK